MVLVIVDIFFVPIIGTAFAIALIELFLGTHARHGGAFLTGAIYFGALGTVIAAVLVWLTLLTRRALRRA